MMKPKANMQNRHEFEADGVCLGGAVGRAACAVAERLNENPFASVAWLRADLTGEVVTEHENEWGHAWHRPFKNFSGDISGRYLEAMALAADTYHSAARLHGLMEVIRHSQHDDGYFAAGGDIDWTAPIDNERGLYEARMMPALWGNSRMLCGLVEAATAFGDNALEQTARRLGDFYVSLLPRFTDKSRIDEYVGGGTYASGYVTCYFPAMEGLVKLHRLTGEMSYLDAAVVMANFYAQFDTIPVDHSHGMLCCQVGLLLLHEATGDVKLLQRLEKRWDALVEGGYINAAGGILEKCRPVFVKDEGCALVDWLRLNLALARITGRSRYWAMAERVLLNHLLHNQTENGGFGHRNMVKDSSGPIGFASEQEEAKWCCTFHGLLGFELLAAHLRQVVAVKPGTVKWPMLLDATVTHGGQAVSASVKWQAASGEVCRQLVTMILPACVSVRVPAWAKAVHAVDAEGEPVAAVKDDDWLTTREPVNQVTWVYAGDVHDEPRPGPKPEQGPEAFAYLGPVLLRTSAEGEPLPLFSASCGKTVRFMSRPARLAAYPSRPFRAGSTLKK